MYTFLFPSARCLAAKYQPYCHLLVCFLIIRVFSQDLCPWSDLQAAIQMVNEASSVGTRVIGVTHPR